MNLGFERSYPTPVSNSPLLPLLLLSLARQKHTPDVSTKIMKEYDFVIVGGGSAGSVLANRLSEKPCVSVLLLEAGHEPPLLTEVPAFAGSFWYTDVDWQYKTVPQKYTAKALNNRQVVMPRAKMLGGCSSHNSMLYVRGNKKNYDDWEAQGAKGWSYKDVLPYFLKLEDNKDYEFSANGYRARGGPITVHQPRYDSEFKPAVYEAATNMGYKFVDINGARQTGFYDLQANLRDNQRCGTAKAYLVNAENRSNLDILPNAMATKIIIKDHRARGVHFDFRGHTYQVKARKEIILSAGAINTPQLLMLSGVGPKRELQRLGIPVVADLPVGQNFHDHIQVYIPYVLSPRIPDFDEKLSDPDNIKQYIDDRTGPLASSAGFQIMAFLKDQLIEPHVDFPNNQLFFCEMGTSTAKNQFNIKPEVFQKFYGPYENVSVLMCAVSQEQPRSRGSVTLQSKNPYDSPIIDPNYFANPIDVEETVQGMKTCHRIATSRSMRKLGVKPFKTVIPGCEQFVHDEDDYFRCFIRSILASGNHPVGTVKMGNHWDPSTVVDPKLRVKNVKGLRVVDASVMPIIPSGNINVPTIMIAEKASDIIKETISCYKNWDDSEEPSKWLEDGESWEDKETIWVEDGMQWKKPNDKIIIRVDHEDGWEKPDKETERKDEEQWEKLRDKEIIWAEHEDKWVTPNHKEGVWEDEERWENSKNKEITLMQHEDQWKKPKVTGVPKHQWDVVKDTETWTETEAKPLDDYFKPTLYASGSESKDYHDIPQKSSWFQDGKYYPKDFIQPGAYSCPNDNAKGPHIGWKHFIGPVQSPWRYEITDSNTPTWEKMTTKWQRNL